MAEEKDQIREGGPGSGFFGHPGRPGQVGGSSSEGPDLSSPEESAGKQKYVAGMKVNFSKEALKDWKKGKLQPKASAKKFVTGKKAFKYYIPKKKLEAKGITDKKVKKLNGKIAALSGMAKAYREKAWNVKKDDAKALLWQADRFKEAMLHLVDKRDSRIAKLEK